tara:strand:- start:3 stop:674 length:672 start_codon:yes stop_codon:yes gene_type:complete
MVSAFPRTNSTIPRIIHQTWIGPREMPDWCKEQAREIREVHEKLGWEYKLWGNEVLDLYKDDKFLANYLKNPELYKWAYINDRVRAFVLRDFGGVYIDVDCKIVKPLDYCLDRLTSNISFFCGARRHKKTNAIFEGSVMGAIKNSRILVAILDSYKSIDWANGGGMHSDVILENMDVDVAIFNYRRFLGMEITEDTIVSHEQKCLGSWYKSDEQLEKLGYKLN